MIAIEGETDARAVWTEAVAITAEAEAVVAVESAGNVEIETDGIIVANRDREVDPENLHAQVVDG